MSETQNDHWREPPKQRTNPAYPPHLTDRYNDTTAEGETVIYDETNTDAWVCCSFSMELDSML